MEKRYRRQRYKRWLHQLSIQRHYDRVIEMCTDYLSQKLSISNCIDILIFAHNHGMHRLYRLTASFIDVNFELVFTSDEFFELNIDQIITLMPLLIYDEMAEIDMQNALLLWSKYKRIEQRRNIDRIRPNYKSWQNDRDEQQQHQQQPTMALKIKDEPHDEPAESTDDIPEAPPPPRISD